MGRADVRMLVHLSDLHFGRIDPAVLRRAVHEAAPDLVAISGDFTQRARRTRFAAGARLPRHARAAEARGAGQPRRPVLEAATVSLRGRGEQPSFNLLRIQRPEISLANK